MWGSLIWEEERILNKEQGILNEEGEKEMQDRLCIT